MAEGGSAIGVSVNPVALIYGSYLGMQGSQQEKDWKSDLNKWMDNRPIYQVQNEYSQNQKLAAQTAKNYSDLTKSGNLPGQQYQEDNLSQNTANSLAQAQMYGTTNPAILAQLSQSALQSQNQNSRDLSIAGANLRQENYANLAAAMQAQQAANTAMAEEKDKAWNYNINDPYQNRIQQARENIKIAQDKRAKGMDMMGGGLGLSL